MQTADGDAEHITAAWENDTLTITDAEGREISQPSLKTAEDAEIDDDITVTQASEEIDDDITLTQSNEEIDEDITVIQAAAEIDEDITISQTEPEVTEVSDSYPARGEVDVIRGFNADNDELQLPTADLMDNGTYGAGDFDEFTIANGIATFTNEEDLDFVDKFDAILTAMDDNEVAAAFQYVETEDDVDWVGTTVLHGDGLQGVQNSDIIVDLVGVHNLDGLGSILTTGD